MISQNDYILRFLEVAAKEFNKLDPSIQVQIIEKLKEILKDPYNAPRLTGKLKNCFKVKLRSAGYRLVYTVNDREVEILVIAVGKRDKKAVYKMAMKRV